MNLEAMFPGGQWDPTHTKWLVMKGRYFWPAAVYDTKGDLVVTDFGRRIAKLIPEPEPPKREILHAPRKEKR